MTRDPTDFAKQSAVLRRRRRRRRGRGGGGKGWEEEQGEEQGEEEEHEKQEDTRLDCCVPLSYGYVTLRSVCEKKSKEKGEACEEQSRQDGKCYFRL